MLYNTRAQALIRDRLHRPKDFHRWVRSLKLVNFRQFREAWTAGREATAPQTYLRLYRELCCRFYEEEAVSYILTSRMKNPHTKLTHLRYLHRFLEGLADPHDFNYFKK